MGNKKQRKNSQVIEGGREEFYYGRVREREGGLVKLNVKISKKIADERSPIRHLRRQHHYTLVRGCKMKIVDSVERIQFQLCDIGY